jgi:hypothetical protein
MKMARAISHDLVNRPQHYKAVPKNLADIFEGLIRSDCCIYLCRRKLSVGMECAAPVRSVVAIDGEWLHGS